MCLGDGELKDLLLLQVDRLSEEECWIVAQPAAINIKQSFVK